MFHAKLADCFWAALDTSALAAGFLVFMASGFGFTGLEGFLATFFGATDLL